MGEALALGTLAVFRSAGPKQQQHDSSQLTHRSAATLDASSAAASYSDETSPESARAGLNYGAYAVRLSGQDSERGTFNQRHGVLYNQINGARCACPTAGVTRSMVRDTCRRQSAAWFPMSKYAAGPT